MATRNNFSVEHTYRSLYQGFAPECQGKSAVQEFLGKSSGVYEQRRRNTFFASLKRCDRLFPENMIVTCCGMLRLEPALFAHGFMTTLNELRRQES
ncbi:hypothetical protein U27_02335 [Candidatus Vecturithrix granuli]|uniref:Uncharacterized protein n=1 Tax=Vecturithrix granuli TaxID=1499967 RepID=A0A0S6W751_VECG1|nr:hypothetical protein U27_02335 [Candidatus Vecturithrix granuli]